MNRFLFCAFISFVLISSPRAQRNRKIPSEKPRLVVGIVIEQMRYDYIVRYWDKFTESGFQRLINEGAFCKNTRYSYLNNQTAPGIATIATGTQPSNHGIINNEWYLRTEKEVTFCVDDKDALCVGGNEMSGYSSPKLLEVSTIGDELKLSSLNRSKVIGISMEPETAILSAGHNANAAYWYDAFSGNFVSTNYYMDTLPNWVKDFNAKKFPETYLANNWEMLLPAGDYTESLPDRNKYEIGIKKNEISFPYILPKLRKGKNDFSLIKTTPYGNMLTKDFAINAIVNEELGKDDISDMLFVTFSAMEEIGNRFGPLSIEMEDAYLRLDAEIGHLLNFLDEYVGKENLLVYLTSDHGAPFPLKYLQDNKLPAGEFKPKPAISLLKSYTRILYGPGNWLSYYQDGQIYLNRNLIDDSKIELNEIQNKVANFIVQFNGVSNAVETSSLKGNSNSGGIFSHMQNGYHQKRSGDIIINLRPGWVEEHDNVIRTQSPYNYDSHIPLIWYGWKVKRNTIQTPVDPSDIAPTISQFLNIALPNAATGKPIKELID